MHNQETHLAYRHIKLTHKLLTLFDEEICFQTTNTVHFRFFFAEIEKCCRPANNNAQNQKSGYDLRYISYQNIFTHGNAVHVRLST